MSKTLRRFTSGILACGLALSSAAADLPLRIFFQPGESIGASGEESEVVGNPQYPGKMINSEEIIDEKKVDGSGQGAEVDTWNGSDGKKYYENVNGGIHTDKTATVNGDSFGTQGRTFDLELESWKIGTDTADVGLVLDASGSMAWASEELDPIILSDEQITTLGITKVGSEISEYDAKTFPWLNDTAINLILTNTDTDNNLLSYTDYRYYVYDPKSTVSEFAPLGYWQGKVKNLNAFNTNGYYPFDKDPEENTYGKLEDLTVLNKVENYTFKSGTNGSNLAVSGGNAYKGSNGLDPYKTMDDSRFANKNYGGILLSELPSAESEFTISFAAKVADSCGLLAIAPLDKDYKLNAAVFRAEKNKDKNRFTWSRIKEDGSFTGNSDKLSYSDKFVEFTFVFKRTTDKLYITTYAKKSDGTIEHYDVNYDSSQIKDLSSPDTPLSIILAPQMADSSVTVTNKSYIDELYYIDEALTEEQVENFDSLINVGETAITRDSKGKLTLGTANYVDPETNEESPIAQLTEKAYDKAMPGWYYVNPAGSFSNYTTTGTGKEYLGMWSIYDDKGNANKVSNKVTKEIPKLDDADTDLQFDIATDISGEPIKFFVDSNNCLRCYFSSSKDNKNNRISYVYDKNGADIKVQSLEKALNMFTSGLWEKSNQNRISAVRFSSDFSDKNIGTVTKNSDGSITTSFDENIDKFNLLNWTAKNEGTIAETGEIKPGLFNLSEKEKKSSKDINDVTGLPFYSLTGSTPTYTGIAAYWQNYFGKEQVGAKKYLIVFTDGLDTNFIDDNDDLILDSEEEIKANYSKESDQEKNITKRNEYLNMLTLTNSLKEHGYTIFTVMLNGGGENTYDSNPKIPAHLKNISGKKGVDLTTLDTDDKLVKEYVFSTGASDLTNTFRTILDKMNSDLEDYTVQDYIDPRFDLIDSNGNVIKLGAGGKISFTGEDGAKAGKTIDSDTNYLVYTPKDGVEIDGKPQTANLYYDSGRDMYYLRWTNCDIPATISKQENLNGVWHSKITVQAKADFIGGNAVLTNGNEAGMNLVYSPEQVEADGKTETVDNLADYSGTNRAVPGYKGTVEDKGNIYPSKGFPKTTVNVRLLPLNTNDREDVIYLGEVIAPKRMLLDLENNYVTDTYYLEYLQRYAYRYTGDAIFGSGGSGATDVENRPLIKLLNTWLAVDDESVKDKKFSIPYMYLPQPEYNADWSIKAEGTSIMNSSGTSTNQKDIVGILTYEWKNTDEDFELDKGEADVTKKRNKHVHPYIKEDTEEVKYSLTVTYTPIKLGDSGDVLNPAVGSDNAYRFVDDPKFNIEDSEGDKVFKDIDKAAAATTRWTFHNREDSNKALVTDGAYEWDNKYKPVAGEEQLETITDENKGIYGDADIDKDNKTFDVSADYYKNVVSGGVALELLVKAEDLKNSDCNVIEGKEYTLTAKRTFDAEYDYDDKYTNIGNTGVKDLPDFAPQDYQLTFKVIKIPEDYTSKGDEELIPVFAKLTTVEYTDKEGTLKTAADNQLPIGTYTFSMPKDGDLTVVKGGTEKFTYMSADTDQSKYNKGYFEDKIFTVPTSDSGRNVSSYLIKCDSNANAEQKYIAPSTQTSAESVTYYLGTESNNTIGVTNKNSNDYYINDRLGIIMLSYGTMKLDVKKEVTGTNLKENLEAEWKFQITLKSSEKLLEEYSYKKQGAGITDAETGKLKFTVVEESDGSYTATSENVSIKGGQTLTLTDINSGVSYTVEELPISDQENANKNLYKDGDYTVKCASNSGVITPGSNVTYINEFPHAELPSTGGTGTVKLIIIGAGLTVAALALLLINRKRR